MNYTKCQIIQKCKQALTDANTFYTRDIVNYTGKTSDTNEYYTEIIAEFILNNLNTFQQNIPMISRKSSYKMESHIGNLPTSNRQEEIIAIKMFNQSYKNRYIYNFIGKIIDYQTPLKSAQTDVAGKIDLLSYDGKNLYILELKRQDSRETMLRCVLEAYTYMQTVDKKKLLSDFNLPKNTIINASPLVFKNSNQHQEMKQNKKWLNKLMYTLNITPYYIISNNGNYSVTI